MKKNKSVFLYSNAFEKYHYPETCPFKTERVPQVVQTLKSMGLLNGSENRVVAPEPAERDILALFHSPDYLDMLQKSETRNMGLEALHMGIGGPDNPIFNGMYGYGALACGATVLGAEMLLSGEADVAFNPSGGHHHAMPSRAAGFCYLNDVAIACAYLSSKGKRVLYLDIDVHHGDGVQHAFYDRNDVMTISLHENGKFLFPGTGFTDEIGSGDGEGYSVNLPFPPGTYNEIYLHAFSEIAIPLMQSFSPDIIIFELGADGLAGDPLAHLKLTNQVYQTIIRELLDFNLPILMTGGGGYHIENTVRAWALAWAVITGQGQHLEDMNLGMGGVMLESTDWLGGLQDRALPVEEEQRAIADSEVESLILKIKETVFPFHIKN